jgi:ribose transport system ATP-binding protein
VLRDGEKTGTYSISDLSFDEMIEKMVGGKVADFSVELSAPGSEVRLEVEAFSVPPLVKDIGFYLRRGEIIAFTGLMGAGKTELARGLAGVDRATGTVRVNGKKVHLSSPGAAIRAGISFLTEDRKQQGLVLDHSLADNYGLPNGNRLSTFGIFDHTRKIEETETETERLRIKTSSVHLAARTLSGGNQQKIVLAKWLGLNTNIILFDEPTRGIDINGRRDFYRIIVELAKNGTSVVLFTSDYTEALQLAHRVFVMRNGEAIASFPNGSATESQLLHLAAGGGERSQGTVAETEAQDTTKTTLRSAP